MIDDLTMSKKEIEKYIGRSNRRFMILLLLIVLNLGWSIFGLAMHKPFWMWLFNMGTVGFCSYVAYCEIILGRKWRRLLKATEFFEKPMAN